MTTNYSALNMNQFAMAPVVGDMDASNRASMVFPCVVSNNIGNGVVLSAGQPVKLDTAAAAGGPPKVIPLASAADEIFGYVIRNAKDISFVANMAVEVACFGSMMWMSAAAAITQGSALESVFGGTISVKTWAGINPVAGFAFDQAVNVGDLIRVLILEPKNNTGLKNISVTATLAQINAGLVLIPGALGKQIVLTDMVWKVTGAFATQTSTDLRSDATAVQVASEAVAGLTNGATIIPAESHMTLGTGYAAALPAGEGLKVVNVGTAATGGTSITFNLTYILTGAGQ
jgi:hypothetical protein